jgi:hypothetical protein
MHIITTKSYVLKFEQECEIISQLLFSFQKDEGHGTKTLKQLVMTFYKKTL